MNNNDKNDDEIVKILKFKSSNVQMVCEVGMIENVSVVVDVEVPEVKNLEKSRWRLEGFELQ